MICKNYLGFRGRDEFFVFVLRSGTPEAGFSLFFVCLLPIYLVSLY
jgi:hypothetical protein